MRKTGVLQITLKSDLCIGSGYSYAGIIDSDVCYDTCGIPYIPGKRLKGCLRETAENVLYSLITEEDIKNIFGTAGNEKGCGLAIGNAYIENYDKIHAELDYVMKSYPQLIQPQDILGQFTHVQAQTKIVDGVAEDTALRYTRVVNQYSPFDKTKEITFYAEIFLDDNESHDKTKTNEAKLENIAKATRNIGLKRNRGIGSVKCRIQKVELCQKPEYDKSDGEEYGEREYSISYVLRNEEPLMLSAKSDSHSEKYIAGQRVLGVLASKYLEYPGKSADDEQFIDLFLNGKVKYTNAMPYKNEKIFYPAPEYVNYLKLSKKLVNTQFSYTDEEEDYNPEHGNQPKKLKNKFVAIDNENKVEIADVDMSIIYHHSHKGESQGGNEGILYSVEAVRERQYFAGEIYVPGKYVDLVKALLENNELRFGKSTTAQYGKCVLVKELCVKERDSAAKKFKSGTDIMITFLSDAIFVNASEDDSILDYTVYYGDLQKIVANQLKIKFEAQEKFRPMLQTKQITGYQSKWNLRKQPVPAIKAGSCLVYRLAEDAIISEDFIGERNQEGFGQIRVDSLEEHKYMMEECGVVKNDDPKDIQCNNKRTQKGIQYNNKLIQNILLERIMDKLRLDAITQDSLGISSSAIGRATLMLKESMDENRDNAAQAFSSFVNRVESIKNKEVKEEITNKIIKKIGKQMENGWSLVHILGYKKTAEEVVLLKETGWDEARCKQEVNNRWGEYLLLILTQQKYMKKM